MVDEVVEEAVFVLARTKALAFDIERAYRTDDFDDLERIVAAHAGEIAFGLDGVFKAKCFHYATLAAVF